METVGVLGYGAIGQYVAANWGRLADHYHLTSVFGRAHSLRCFPCSTFPDCVLTDDPEVFLRQKTDIVVEAIGHSMTKVMVPRLLEQGRVLYLLSVGVMADHDFVDRLTRAAGQAIGRVRFPAGAMAGFDGLQALARSGAAKVRYVSKKPPQAWIGTPAEECCDLAALQEAVTFFKGSAREASGKFPKNVNLGAAVALAGVGVDSTEVELIADPTIARNVGIVRAEADIGSMELIVSGSATVTNPKTSVLAGASVISALLNQKATFQFV